MKPTQVNIAICGHAKHGKSTVAGRLLFELGAVSDRELEKSRDAAEERNRKLGSRDFNEFSMMFLKHRSVTFSKSHEETDPSRTDFPDRRSASIGENLIVTLIDTPGFSQYINNIVYGIYLADHAILVVEAAKGVETLDVPRIAASFATPVIAVLVTKMDLVGYTEARFEEIKRQITEAILPLLREYLPGDPPIIPVSALSGVGFTAKPQEMPWYEGVTVTGALNQAEHRYNPANTNKTRWTVEGSREIFRSTGRGPILLGTLETGELHPDQQLLIEPASTIARERIVIRTIEVQAPAAAGKRNGFGNSESVRARSIVAVATTGRDENELNKLFRYGGVLGTPDDPPSVASSIEAEVIFFQPDTFYNGKEYVIYTSASRGTARIEALLDRDLISYELERSNKYAAAASELVHARLKFDRPMCIESSMEFQRLTRFILREHNRIVACGRCLRIVR